MLLRVPRLLRISAGALGLVVALAACSDGIAGADDRVRVEAGFYPLAWVAEQVGGQHVRVRSLTEPGAEPHELELTPKAVAQLLEADVIVYLGGFQPAVDDAAGEADADRRFDVAQEGARLDLTASGALVDGSTGRRRALDPHFWLDPTRLAAVATNLGRHLATVDPDHAASYRSAARRLSGRLAELDASFRQGLATCARRDVVTSHRAFGYLARRYGLREVGITGVAPEMEPSPADLAALTTFVRDHGVGTIFFETLVSPAVARTVARETGARTAVLDPIEGITGRSPGRDYVEVMRADLSALRTALGCS